MLTIYIDFKSPGSYLAMRPALALANRHGVTLDWKPFRTVERDVPKLENKANVGETHRRVRAASRRSIHQKYAKIQGIDLQFPSETSDTDLALGSLALVKGNPIAFIEAAFSAYWIDHADLNEIGVVQQLLARSKADLNDIDKDSCHAALARAQAEAEEQGVVEAPAFLIDDQLFIGREHLPWIEEILTGR